MHRVCLGLLLMLASACSTSRPLPVRVQPAADPEATGNKVVRFEQFVGEGLLAEEVLLPLEVVIPAQYEPFKFPQADPNLFSYWMPKEQGEAALQSGELPASGGYFYSKISLDVGFDEEKGIFVGMEDADYFAKAKEHGMENVKWERSAARRYPAIFGQFDVIDENRTIYFAYIAPLYETNVFYIAYIPPVEDSSRGVKTWSRFRSALSASDTPRQPS